LSEALAEEDGKVSVTDPEVSWVNFPLFAVDNGFADVLSAEGVRICLPGPAGFVGNPFLGLLFVGIFADSTTPLLHSSTLDAVAVARVPLKPEIPGTIKGCPASSGAAAALVASTMEGKTDIFVGGIVVAISAIRPIPGCGFRFVAGWLIPFGFKATVIFIPIPTKKNIKSNILEFNFIMLTNNKHPQENMWKKEK